MPSTTTTTRYAVAPREEAAYHTRASSRPPSCSLLRQYCPPRGHPMLLDELARTQSASFGRSLNPTSEVLRRSALRGCHTPIHHVVVRRSR